LIRVEDELHSLLARVHRCLALLVTYDVSYAIREILRWRVCY